jgi:ribosomal protein S18 acetylase RimI-like enzyme/acyl carrier protein
LALKGTPVIHEENTMDRASIISALSEVAPGHDFDGLTDEANLIELGLIDSALFLDLINLLEERSGHEIDFLNIDAALLTSVNGLIAAFGPNAEYETNQIKGPDEGPRVLTDSDLEDAVATIIVSFSADPVMAWLLPNPKKRIHFLHKFASLFLEDALPNRRAHALSDFSGVAIWTSPGGKELSNDMRSLFAEHVSLNALRQYFSMSEQLDARKPVGQYCTLQLIGVDPVQQRQGIATALLDRGLREADARKLPVYLESTNPKNIALYRRCGFEVLEEAHADGAPPRTGMVRSARK